MILVVGWILIKNSKTKGLYLWMLSMAKFHAACWKNGRFYQPGEGDVRGDRWALHRSSCDLPMAKGFSCRRRISGRHVSTSRPILLISET
jgi:hypothetical protein